MNRTNKPVDTLPKQMKRKMQQPKEKKKPDLEGFTEVMVSTGSTLLNLEISGGRVRGGGVPTGIVVEAFGPSGSGKTVLLCEMGGDVQRKKGEALFQDPESRLDETFASIFDLQIAPKNLRKPDTITEAFKNIRDWKPENPDALNAIFADSLAALSTNLEMDNEDGDKMGQRRAKEFSEGFRKHARILGNRNTLMVCSNQVRQSGTNFKGQPTYKSPGGEALGFYCSLRLRFGTPKKIMKTITRKGKDIEKPIGITVPIEIFKSSVWKPYGKAPLSIVFDYGIDDIRENLQYIKDMEKNTTYMVNERSLGVSLHKAIEKVEDEGLISELKEQVIDLWEDIESGFVSNRKPKLR
jgi:RecA/RadA recombinase